MCMIGGVKEEWDGPKMINGMMMMSHGDEHPGAGVEREREEERVRTLRSARSVLLKTTWSEREWMMGGRRRNLEQGRG